MQVLAFIGSPRKKGNTETLLEAVRRGVVRAGGQVETIRLCELKINPCTGCGGCDRTGVCVQEDDMTQLYGKIIAADRVVVASPIYFYGITAQAKAFVDRCQALWCRKYLLTQHGEWRDDPQRRGFFVSVAGTKGARVFDGAILTLKYGFDAMGFHYGGDFLVKRIDSLGDMAKHPDTLAEAEEAGFQFIKKSEK